MESDRSLVEGTLAGDETAFRTLVERYERPALAVALGILRDHHMAQDAVQDAFLAAFQKLGWLRNKGAFGAWLLQIVRRRALRLQRQAPATIPPTDNLREAACSPVIRDSEQRLLDAVARLPKSESQTITLHYFENHSVAEVAAMLDRPVGSVTKLISRARLRLRGWLEGMDL
jgi:RNA polymerase sigma factor (sigma-70 family)